MTTFRLIIAAITCFFFASCSKDSNSPLPPEPVKEYFRGKFNGIVFNDTIKGKIMNTSINGLNGMRISGYHGNSEIVLMLQPYTGKTGEILLNQDNFIIFGFGNYSTSYRNGGGKIHILEIADKYIRGTFEGVLLGDPYYSSLSDTLVVSAGEFKLKRP